MSPNPFCHTTWRVLSGLPKGRRWIFISRSLFIHQRVAFSTTQHSFFGGKKSNPVLKPIFSVQGEHGWCSPNSSGKLAMAGKVLWGWKERGKSYGTTLGTIFTNSGSVVGSISPFFFFPFHPVFLIDLGLTDPVQERWSEAVWLQTQRCEEFTAKPVGKRILHHRGEMKILLFLRNKSPAPHFLSKHGVGPLWETLSFSPKYLTSLPCLLPSRPSKWNKQA